MNKMKEVAQLLGVELGEKFKIAGINGVFNNTYAIAESGLKDCINNALCPEILSYILVGTYEIIKIPFKPKYDEEYWYYSSYYNRTINCKWANTTGDYCYHKLGNCFRTEHEAETKGKEIMEKIMKEYEHD